MIDRVEKWPRDPEEHIRQTCRTFGLAEPVEYTDWTGRNPETGQRWDYANLQLMATLADGSKYLLAHSPISQVDGRTIIGRARDQAELDYLSRVRSIAGRAGAAARWGEGPRATSCVRLYPSDAAELRRRARERGVRPADVVAELLRGEER